MQAIRKTALRLYEGFGRAKLALALAVGAVYIVLTLYGGVRIWHLPLFCLSVAGYIVLPGLLWADALRVKRIHPQLYGPLALLLGTGFFAALYCVAMRLGILWLLQILPLLMGVVWLAARLRKYSEKPWAQTLPRPNPQQWMLVLLFCALLLFYTFYGVVKNAHPIHVGNTLLNQDLLWNVGNANSFKLAFPPQDIRFEGVRLSYHYLTEMLTGALSIVSSIPAYDIAAFLMQPYMLAAMVLCLYRFGRILWPEGQFRPLLFSYSLFLFSCASLWKILPNGWSVFWNSNITHLVTNINGQTTATVYLCIFAALLVVAMRAKYKVGPLHYLYLLCALVMLSFAKGPVAAIVVCSLVLTVLIGLAQKKAPLRALVFALVAAGLFALIYVAMFSGGANDSMPFSLTGTLEKGYFGNILNLLWHTNHTLWAVGVPLLMLAQSFLMMPGTFPLYARGLVHDVRHFGRLSQPRCLAHGVVAGGLLAFFLFNHPSMSQVYFLFAAVFFVCVLAVDSLGFLCWPGACEPQKSSEQADCEPAPPKRRHPVAQRVFVAFAAFFAAAAVLTSGFLYVHYLGSGARQLARNLGFIEKYPYDAVMTADDEAGMLWFAQNSPQTAMFATNRIHTGARREGISNLYSALSGRQGYMEGFSYAKTNMGVAEEVINEKYWVNETLFSAETAPEDVVHLAQEYGIGYLVYSTQFDGAETQFTALQKVYDSPTLRIYAVPPKPEAAMLP